MESWRQRQGSHTVDTQKDNVDCFEAICRPTLTFPQCLVKIIVVSQADWRQKQEQTRALKEGVRECRGEEGEEMQVDTTALQDSGSQWYTDNGSWKMFFLGPAKEVMIADKRPLLIVDW